MTDVHIYACTYTFLLLVCSNDVGFASFRLFAKICQTVRLVVNQNIFLAVMDHAIHTDVRRKPQHFPYSNVPCHMYSWLVTYCGLKPSKR